MLTSGSDRRKQRSLKTVKARILEYAEAIGWTFVPCDNKDIFIKSLFMTKYINFTLYIVNIYDI